MGHSKLLGFNFLKSSINKWFVFLSRLYNNLPFFSFYPNSAKYKFLLFHTIGIEFCVFGKSVELEMSCAVVFSDDSALEIEKKNFNTRIFCLSVFLFTLAMHDQCGKIYFFFSRSTIVFHANKLFLIDGLYYYHIITILQFEDFECA